jgi:hypothetical protein
MTTKRKTFLSYYHADDQDYKREFERLFSSLIVPKSVGPGDINTDNSTEYIKQLIQKEYLADTSVLVVLVGPKTKCRKHVDWEISGALNKKVGEVYAGLIGILLPTHPDFHKLRPSYSNLPARLADNYASGYSKIHKWTTNKAVMKTYIEDAFHGRKQRAGLRTNSRIQMQRNTCD